MQRETRVDLGVLIKPLVRWWWLLLASTALAFVSTYLHQQQQPAYYEATTTLMIGRTFEDPNPSGSDLALGQQLAATYADLALRQKVREQTMAALGLTSLPDYSAIPLPNRELLEITVVDTDPQRAKAVADELARQLILQSPTAPKPEEQERQAFISQQLVSLQQNIERTEAELVDTQTQLENAFDALEISRLQGQVEALQEKLSTLQTNYAALVATTNDGATNTIEVIESAKLPVAPNDSAKTQTIWVAAALALALAAGTAYLLEYLDDTVHTADDLARVGNFNYLPGIPVIHRARGAAPILAQEAPRSPATDAFRALRTGLYAATAHASGKMLLITSAVPQEGKSVVAANLAAVLAESEKNVLLIDGDLRQPMQHKLHGLPRENGLAELLLALKGHELANGSRDMITRAIQATKQARLSLIVAGQELSEAGGLIGSDTMKSLLHTLALHADYVIIDSPPLLAVADALVLSTLVDSVVLVARAGASRRRQVDQALRSLKEVNANVAGIVLNRQRVKTDAYYKYYHPG